MTPASSPAGRTCSGPHLLGATKQVGSDLVIIKDVNNTITLKNVALANFTSDDAIFV